MGIIKKDAYAEAADNSHHQILQREGEGQGGQRGLIDAGNVDAVNNVVQRLNHH